MRRLTLMALLLAAPFVMGQSLGGGSLGNGALGGGTFRGAVGGTMHYPTDAECMPPALVDYDARTLGPGAAITTWANNGTGGTGWDVTQATGLDKPTATASCQNGNTCASFVDTTDHLRQAVAQSVTWTVTYVCFVAELNLGGNRASFAWGNNATVLTNSILPRTTNNQVNGASGTTRQISVIDGWQTVCLDMTTETAPYVSVNGGAATLLGTLAGAEFLDPNLFSIGRDFSDTWFYDGGKIGRIVAYNTDPGLTIQDLSTCLATQWGT